MFIVVFYVYSIFFVMFVVLFFMLLVSFFYAELWEEVMLGGLSVEYNC